MPSEVTTVRPEPPLPRPPRVPSGMLAEEAKARPEGAGEGTDGNPSSPPPSSKAAFTLQVRDWDKAIKFVVAITALASLVLSIKNTADKAPVPQVQQVETKIENIERRVDGTSDQKGASSEGESLSERVTALEKVVRPMVANRCPWQQFEAQIFERLGARGIKVQNCPAPTKIEAQADMGLPGRPRPRNEWVIETPMPAP
jgi:hypothetical protein